MNEKREEKKQETLASVIENGKQMEIVELDDALAEKVAGGDINTCQINVCNKD